MLLHIKGEFTMEKLKSSLSFLATQIEKYPGGDHSNVTCYYRQHICPFLWTSCSADDRYSSWY